MQKSNLLRSFSVPILVESKLHQGTYKGLQIPSIAVEDLTSLANALIHSRLKSLIEKEKVVALLRFITNCPANSRNSQDMTEHPLAGMEEHGLSQEALTAGRERGDTNILEAMVAEKMKEHYWIEGGQNS